MTETMPECLKAIYEETHRFQHPTLGNLRLQPSSLPPSNLDVLQQAWAAHVSEARRRIPGLHVEAGGEVVYLGALSPGCQACKEGTWDCLFVTMRCNLDCAFCYSPHAIPRDYAGSVFGETPEQIAANHARTRITGVSFSGGEPFVEVQRLFDWVAWFKARYPDRYYWVYTNGLLASAEHLRRLGELGVDEVRFNTAATGYDCPQVVRNMAAAARLIPNVTIEIPAIPEHAARLLSCLADWCALGVRFLNLHELMYEPGTNSAAMPGPRQDVVTADGHRSAVHPRSRALTLAVMERVQEKGLPLAVNDCSLQSKLRQVRGRRRNLAPLVSAPYEKLIADQAYESCCAYLRRSRLQAVRPPDTAGQEVHFFHPDALEAMRQRYPGHAFVRLVRTAPLSLQDRGRWIVFEKLA